MPGLNVSVLPDGRRAFILRTSDSINFKSCRRKWGWSSHLKMNLGPTHLAGPLWFGSAIHYALEDFHGWNHFGNPQRAFVAYCVATSKNWARDLPPEYPELFELGKGMMDYYENYWLRYKPMDKTYWCANAEGILEPQVEVNFEIPIPIDINPTVHRLALALGVDIILYRGTIDRVVVDEYGALWVDEYKTAKVIQVQHYQTDPQISRYVWACGQIYDRPIAGVIYHQFQKKMPELPRILSSGKVSTASNLFTSYPLYRQRLMDLYGDVESAPEANVKFLWDLASSETEDRDRYIRRDKIHRTVQQVHSQGALILLELEDMLNADLPLYPNPTRDCSRMCSFLSPCVSLDDGGDWELELDAEYTPRDLDIDRLWRKRLPDPKSLLQHLEEVDAGLLPPIDLGVIQVQSRDSAMRSALGALDVEGGSSDDYGRPGSEDVGDGSGSYDLNPTFDITA